MMKSPSPDRPANGRQRLRAGGRLEAVREDSFFPLPPHRLPRTKCKAEKVERDVGKVSTPFCILAVDLSSQGAVPTCRPQSGRQARSIPPAPRRRSGSDKWRRPRNARTECEDRFSPSTYRTHNAETDSPGGG